jgi:hypothetical protein
MLKVRKMMYKSIILKEGLDKKVMKMVDKKKILKIKLTEVKGNKKKGEKMMVKN